MKAANILASLLVALAGSFLVSCQSGHGPLLINVSGEPARLLVQADSGATFDGTCADQEAVWVGRSGAKITRVEIRMPATQYVLQGEDLVTPFGKDETTAFVLEAAGPRKLTLDEAKILMRNRP